MYNVKNSTDRKGRPLVRKLYFCILYKLNFFPGTTNIYGIVARVSFWCFASLIRSVLAFVWCKFVDLSFDSVAKSVLCAI
ncbi:unnamed protein product [Acanthoscelides obtectus]|uniref:Uncharacterized protein n=1 Tax=Acanthoscelides obtectus TaxID=200917 RepID=A0A9P0KA40_ACAOB|nr:unnamed protein product [Acanthoscelides obtectus]CAK1645497.1 hypothetical protein AOBTE_LOCUS14128 [Acanthoscelides obtectus]